CITCHDPHARASADRGWYETVCRSCHAGRGAPLEPPPPAPAPPTGRARAPGVPCPVSPWADCIECHMPRVDSGQPILFTDHWLRVRRPGDLMGVTRRAGASLDLDPTEP